jgi:hypothetical protein
LILDGDLKGRASEQTRIYDMGRIACDGLKVETVRERASEVLTRIPVALEPWGFDCRSIESFRQRLETDHVPADDIVAIFQREKSLEATLHHLSNLV